MKIATLLLLVLPGSLLAQTTEMVRKPTADHRITELYGYTWGAMGQAHVFSPEVPKGKLWVIENAGIATKDGREFEWMMQVAIINPTGAGSYWLVPNTRLAGTSGGTPALAITRRTILSAGRALAARCNGLDKPDPDCPERDRTMAVLWDGWEVDAKFLPYFLGLPRSDASMSAEELAFEQLRASKGF